MTRSEIKTMVRNLLAESDTTFFTDAKLNIAIYEACKKAALDTQYVRSITTSTTSTAGTAEYSIPATALGFVKISWDGDTTELDYRTVEMMSVDYPDWRNDGQSQPWAWMLGDTTGKFRLYPTPNETGKVIKLYTFDIPADFSTDSASAVFPDTFKSAIAFYSCYFLKLGDPDGENAAGGFLRLYQISIAELQNILANPTTQANFITPGLR